MSLGVKMKIYTTRTRPASQYQECTGRKCDLCGAEAQSGDEWSSRYYEVNETEVSISVKSRKGENYPEGGSGTEYEIDLCPRCFTGRLVPWLKSQGAAIEEKEWDW
jgi:hypothetical protein